LKSDIALLFHNSVKSGIVCQLWQCIRGILFFWTQCSLFELCYATPRRTTQIKLWLSFTMHCCSAVHFYIEYCCCNSSVTFIIYCNVSQSTATIHCLKMTNVLEMLEN